MSGASTAASKDKSKKMWNQLRAWARRLKQQTMVAYFAARDAQTPWHVRLLAFAVAAYALSPIDLIPDFIPVLGYLDDVILVPLGLYLVIRLLPEAVITRARAQAALSSGKPASRAMAMLIIVLWIAAAVWAGYGVLEVWQGRASVRAPGIQAT